MSRRVLRIGWYRFRATFDRRCAGYLGLVILIALLGGIAMASIAAARRTQSSYSAFLAGANASDMDVSFVSAGNTPYSATLTDEIANLRGVKRVESIVSLNVFGLASSGAPELQKYGSVGPYGSVDGLLFNQDRVTAIDGRLADPGQADEINMTAGAAQALGLHVGQVIPMGFYTNEQEGSPAFGTPSLVPQRRIDERLVGLVVFDNQVVLDDIDRSFSSFIVFTPALTREELAETSGTTYGLRLSGRGRDTTTVEHELSTVFPPGGVYNIHLTSHIEAQVDRAVKPEAIALGGFGLFAAATALLISLQAVGRQLRTDDDDLRVLRALGAGPATTVGDGLIGILGAIVVGALLATAVAIALSPLSPVGPVRRVYPSIGVSVDWTVLGLGVLVLVVGLAAGAVTLSYRRAPHRRVAADRQETSLGSGLVRLTRSSWMPTPAVVGARFALERGRREGGAVRSALVGAVVAVVTVVATLVFGNSLHTLVSHPALYGWNWDYVLNPTDGIVPPAALGALDHDPDVAAWSGVRPLILQIDNQRVPVLTESAGAQPAPPILSGHGVDGNNQIVLGAGTLGQLHRQVGDTVVVSYGSPADAPAYIPPTSLVVVGTATMPAVGYPSIIADHPSMGTGGLVSLGIETSAFQDAQRNLDPNLNGPNLVFVRLRPGVAPAAGRTDMQRVAESGDKALAADPNGGNSTIEVLGAQRPAEIVNYRGTGSTPFVLAAGLALGAIAGLGLALAASVRRRRRELALLKVLGFTRRQLEGTVAWQATVAALVGVVVGMPLGIATGRQLWVLFARDIYAVPHPTVPFLSVALVALGALVFANVVAAIPGRRAARTPTALVLRFE